MRKYRKKYAKKKWVREIKNVDTDTGSTTERERGGRGWLILLVFEVLRKIRKHKQGCRAELWQLQRDKVDEARLRIEDYGFMQRDHYICNIYFIWRVDGEVQRRVKGVALCLCGSTENI